MTAYLVDTSVAVRRVVRADPLHPVVVRAVRQLRLMGESLLITPQVLMEFHAVATRPTTANGLGLTLARAVEAARRLEAIFPLAPDSAEIYPRWRALVERYGIVGRQVYDARLVAVMQAHGITHILTTNAPHFRRFAEITVVQPEEIR